MAQPALAHAPPLAASILQDPRGGQLVVMNRGLVFRDTARDGPRLLCNEALGISTAELPSVALLPDAGLLVGTTRGLRVTRDQGCTWSSVADMGALSVPAIASDPTNPRVLYLATFGAGATGLRVSRDGAASWSTALALGDGDYVRSILVAANAAHVYATLSTFAPPDPPAHALLHTSDGGTTWQRAELPWTNEDYMISAAATDPSDPETLVLYTVAKSPGLQRSRLLLSRDGGGSFDVGLELPEIRGAAFGADGVLWVAARAGLYRSEAPLSTWEQVSRATELGCVSVESGELLVCGHYAGVGAAGSGIGSSEDGGESFSPWLDFASVASPVACLQDSATAVLCAQPWLDWSFEMLGAAPEQPMNGARGSAPPPVAGSTALPEAMPEERAPRAMSAACALPFSARQTGGDWLATLALLWLWRERRSSRA